jgi:uncharacterized protein
MKANQYSGRYVNSYFWRTHDRAEIDYIEEEDGFRKTFELKWKEQKIKFPASFLEVYPEYDTTLIKKSNFE